jgi:hypothetical protein
MTLGQSDNWIGFLFDFASNRFTEQRHSVFLESVSLLAVFDSLLLKLDDQLPTLTALCDQISKSNTTREILSIC